MDQPNPYRTEVAEAWMALVEAPEIGLDEKRRRWRELYEANRRGGGWLVSLWDAGLIAGLGNSLALEAGDFELARDLAGQFLEHPDLTMGPAHHVDMIEFWVRQGVADVLVGDVDLGLNALQRGLDDKPFAPWKYELILRAHLCGLVTLLGLERGADKRVVAFVCRVIGLFPRCKALSRRAAKATTNGDLLAALRESYRWKVRPLGRASLK